MASPCTNLPSGMASASDMAGHLSSYHRYVSVVAHFLWTMRWHALPVAIQPCVTMRSQWGHNEVTMRSQWGHNEVTMRSQWGHNEVTMRSQWGHNEVTMRSQWGHNEVTMRSQWGHNEVTMRSQWGHNEVTMRSQWGQGPIRILPEEGSSWCRCGIALAVPCWWTVPSSLHVHGGICSPGCCCQRCLERKVRAIVHGRSSVQPACSLQRQDIRTLHVQAAWGRKAAAVWGSCPWCWACLICAQFLLCGRGMWQSCCGLDEKSWFYVVWKRNEPFSVVMASMRCRISFALLWSAVASLRGHRAVRRKSPPEPSAELAVVECQFALWGRCCFVFVVYQYIIIVYTGNSQYAGNLDCNMTRLTPRSTFFLVIFSRGWRVSGCMNQNGEWV